MKWAPEEVQEVWDRYGRGESLREIERGTGIPLSTFRAWIIGTRDPARPLGRPPRARA